MTIFKIKGGWNLAVSGIAVLPLFATCVTAQTSIPSAPVGESLTTLFSQLLAQGAPLTTLYNSADPKTFGAKGDGTSDDSAAFQSALNHGDIIVAPGTYLINTTLSVSSYRTIQCQPGATLLTTRHDSSVTAILNFNTTTNSNVIGCTFQGSNTAVPSGFTPGQQGNFLISVAGGGRNTFLGNVFKNSWAEAAFQMTGGTTLNTVQYCSFESNAFNGIHLSNASSNRVIFNRFIDSSLRNEASVSAEANTGNLIEHNLIQKINGNGFGDVFLTGGRTPAGFNYGGNNVLFNVIRGANYYTTATNGTNANYQFNQVNSAFPPAIPVAPVTTGDPFALSKNMTALLGTVLGQGLPLPTLSNYTLIAPGASIAGNIVHGDGTTDDTAAFQAAVNAGDVVIAPGNYRIDFNGATGYLSGIKVPNYRNIQCQPGVVLNTTLHNNSSTGIFIWSDTGYGNLIGCSFKSTNTSTPPGFVGGQEWNVAVFLVTQGRSVGGTNIMGNDFSSFWANAEIQLYGGFPDTFNEIVANKFSNCGLYGPVPVSGSYNLTGYNKLTDCSLGNEADNTANQAVQENDIIHNEVTMVNGDGYSHNAGIIPMWSNVLTGGTAPCDSGFDYSTNRVVKNLLQGPGSGLDIQTCGNSNPPKPAQYYANQCLNGCTQAGGQSAVPTTTTPPPPPPPPSGNNPAPAKPAGLALR